MTVPPTAVTIEPDPDAPRDSGWAPFLVRLHTESDEFRRMMDRTAKLVGRLALAFANPEFRHWRAHHAPERADWSAAHTAYRRRTRRRNRR